MRTIRCLALSVVIGWGGGLSAAAAEPRVPERDNLNAVLWMQSSAEYKAATLSAYTAARAALDRALADPAWTAALEQKTDFQGKLPAIILDLDETVFDNSAYMAWLVKTGGGFNAQTWAEFVEEKISPPVPGAVEYIRYAMSRGITPFYISNRAAALKPATRESLDELRILPALGEEAILLKREHRDWGVQKGSRRAAVAENYRILQIVGDNLGDFVDDYGVTIAHRAQVVRTQETFWGNRWIMLPNPAYGNWENAAYEYNIKLDEDGRRTEKQRALAPWK
jgi:acid phosphatase